MDINFYDIEDVKAKAAAIDDFDEAGLTLDRLYKDFNLYPDPVKFPKIGPNEWVDMGESVNWNIAKKAELNKARADEAKRLLNLRGEVSQILLDRLIVLLAEYFLIPVDVAAIIYNRAYIMSHDGGIGAVVDTFVEDLGPMVVDCIEVYSEAENAKSLLTEKEAMTNG